MTDFFAPLNPKFPLAAVAADLAAAFESAGFTDAGLAGHLGPEVTEALYRGEPGPVLLATSGGTQLDALIRAFILHEPLTPAELEI